MVERVAVIGAGAAGLCALRHLTGLPGVAAVAYEQARQLGGTWVYTDRVGRDSQGLPVHTSMYRNLRTNLPKEAMAFPDFPFSKLPESFLTHQHVLQYLSDYAKHFQLQPQIKFNTSIELVQPKAKDKGLVWQLWARNLQSKESKMQEFDAVMICNGQFSVPHIPHIAGLETFRGQVLHSHDYRHPEEFAGKRLVLLGGSFSGQDISLDIAPFAKEIFLCHCKPRVESHLPMNVQQAICISKIEANNFVLEDGRIIKDVDVLLFCTGYKYVFPFLARECQPETQGSDRRLRLYKHIVHPAYPTLTFIGIPRHVLPFRMFDLQVRFTLAGLLGSPAGFPSRESMEADIDRDFEKRLQLDMPARHAHLMGKLQWQYYDELAQLAALDPIPKAVQKLADAVDEYRLRELQTYKRRSFEICGPNTFREL